MKKTKEVDETFEMIKNAPLVVIDGNNVALRMFFAHRDLSVMIDGEPFYTGMVYGFTKFLFDFATKYKPKKFLIVWDSRSDYRYSLYSEYKAGRNREHYDLVKNQFKDMSILLQALGVEQWKAKGYEADDLIQTVILVRNIYAGPELNVNERLIVIVSTDKDLLQLVCDDTVVFRPGKNDLITKDNVKEVFNVPVTAIQDYLILCGDSADNIKGVPGIGEKTARKILQSCGNISTALKVESIPGVSKKKLEFLQSEEGKAHIDLSRKLVMLRALCRSDELNIKNPELDLGKAQEIFNKYQIKSLSLDPWIECL